MNAPKIRVIPAKIEYFSKFCGFSHLHLGIFYTKPEFSGYQKPTTTWHHQRCIYLARWINKKPLKRISMVCFDLLVTNPSILILYLFIFLRFLSAKLCIIYHFIGEKLHILHENANSSNRFIIDEVSWCRIMKFLLYCPNIV